MFTLQRAVRGTRVIFIVLGLFLVVLDVGQAVAGGLLLYEVGTADVGLASAGWGFGAIPLKIPPLRRDCGELHSLLCDQRIGESSWRGKDRQTLF